MCLFMASVTFFFLGGGVWGGEGGGKGGGDFFVCLFFAFPVKIESLFFSPWENEINITPLYVLSL